MHRYDLSAFGPFLWNSVKKRSQYALSNYLSNAVLHRQSLVGRRDDVSHDSKNFDLLFPQFSLKIGRFCVLWIKRGRKFPTNVTSQVNQIFHIISSLSLPV